MLKIAEQNKMLRPIFRKYEDEGLTEDVLEIAKEELGETSEKRKTCIYLLKEKIKEHGRENCFPFSEDEELLKFLRVEKFNVDKAFKRMKNMEYQRQKHYKIFLKYHLDACKRTIDMNLHYLLPYRNIDGSSISIATRGHWNTEELSFEEYFLLDHMLLEMFSNSPIDQICGCTLIADCEGLSYRHLLQFTPKRIAMMMNTMQNAIPIRYKAIHVVNSSATFHLIYKLLQPFLSQKIKSRLVFHATDPKFRSLHDFIPPFLLPKKYGGELCAMSNSLLRKCLEKQKAYFLNLLMSDDDYNSMDL